ncbi:hypothetical protein FGG08_005388 [Glutinoglossum americanum]|uniref:NB-ARC domain-containing protein n=1 Tax=Glutinoglossum americanum TaxID=1670608 RepID=A0A9P8I5J2_9PEZI|nr:hypothetical protein FGG08_005388 [Glutinoglossum americanum]
MEEITRDIIDTFDTVMNALEDIRKGLPALETYATIFGSSKLQLLQAPLVIIYVDLTRFALQAIHLFDRSMLQEERLADELGTLGRATWMSLGNDFRALIASIQKNGREVDRIASVEHMNEAHQIRTDQMLQNQKAEEFRQEVRIFFAANANIDPLQSKQPSRIIDAPMDLLTIHFSGREKELDMLREAFERERGDVPTRVVVYGMPGLGKTQLALKYAKSAYDRQLLPYVFWISATTTEKLNQGFSRLFDLLRLPYQYSAQQDARFIAVKLWLESHDFEPERTWLLVLDNVKGETVEAVRGLLPQVNSGGNILFTTRTESVAKAIGSAAGEMHSCFELPTPNPQDAIKMFLRSGEIDAQTSDETHAKAEKLVKCVGRFPLAIDQAASLMKQSRKDMDELLDLYGGKQKQEALGWENKLSSHEERSITATFAYAFLELEHSSPETTDLLRFLCFLDPESISARMIVQGSQGLLAQPTLESTVAPASPTDSKQLRVKNKLRENWRRLRRRKTDVEKADLLAPKEGSTISTDMHRLADMIQSPIRFQNAIEQLHTLSLVNRQGDQPTLTIWIHDSVQYLIRMTLMTDVQRRVWLQRAATVICRLFEKIDDPSSYSSWGQCEVIVTHFQAIIDLAKASEVDVVELRNAVIGVASYFKSRGRYSEAERLCSWALEVRERVLGPDHPATLGAVNNLAVSYIELGRYGDAERLSSRALEGSERVLGPGHPGTLSTVHSLALAYHKLGRYDDAERLYGRALEGSERVLGPDHPNTLRMVHNLAIACRQLGRRGDAERLSSRALEGSERVLGPDHPNTLQVAHSLAIIHRQLGRYDDAERLFGRVLEGNERMLGSDHPETMGTVHSLAVVYHLLGRYNDAERLFGRALEGDERVLGPDHPNTLRAGHDLAIIHRQLGRYGDAERLFGRALEGSERVLGPDHPETLRAMYSLALTYRKLGRYDDAERLYGRALKGSERVLGPDHPETLRAMHSLALTYHKLGRYDDAERLYGRALEGDERRLGPDHLETLRTVHNLAIIHRQLGRYDDAERLFGRALEGNERTLGSSHPDTLRTVECLKQLASLRDSRTE